jgi:hypothetical protein
MNPSFFYAALFLSFGILDYVMGNGSNLKVDFGTSLIFLGVGLNRLKSDDRKT